MRVIAGIAKGMTLHAPHRGIVRPTSERVREAVFSSLGERVISASVLDLYAGTGSLGIEAASRGATSITFVEDAQPALKSLRQNLKTFQQGREISCELTVVCADVRAELKKLAEAQRRFTLIFADPPYVETAQQLLDREEVPHLLDKDGVFVLESAKRDPLIAGPAWKTLREADYGDTRVSLLIIG